MTVRADEAETGKFYRLTRDPGTTFYMICPESARRRLEKRLSTQSPRFMKADDRFAMQALERCEKRGYVLAIRVTRFRSQSGKAKETRAYVSFPPDYVLREVDKRPGYTSGKKTSAGQASARKGLDTESEDEETSESQRKELTALQGED